MAAIICGICGKKQSGWIQDFSISQENYDERICADCNEHLQKLIGTKDDIIFKEEMKHFKDFIAQSKISPKSREYLEMIFDLKNNSEIGESVKDIVSNAYHRKRVKEKEELQIALSNMKITTSYNFEGYGIVKYLDVIFDEKIIGIGIKTTLMSLGDIMASLTGDELYAVTNRINELKRNILVSLKEKAVELGANAIIGIDFETTLPGGSVIMVAVNGTAVIIEKE